MISRRDDIDCLKGIAIIGVVLAHLEYRSRLSPDCMAWVHHFQSILGWCVMAFFFCSGLLTKRPPQTTKEFVSWTGRRLKRLLLPCLAFSIAYKLALMVIGQTNLFQWRSPIPVGIREWLGFLLLPASPQFYFLPFLLAISLIFCPLLAIIRRPWIVWGATTALYLLIGFWAKIPSSPFGPAFALLIPYGYCFVLGLVAETITKGVDLWLATNFILGIGAAIFWRTEFFLYPLVPLILLRCFQKAGSIIYPIGLPRLGRFSSAIYVWHAPLLLPFCSIFWHRLLADRLQFLQVSLTLATTISLCYAIDRAIRRLSWLEPFHF